jgi:RNA polymerase sigma-70 factor, ECF subfamily
MEPAPVELADDVRRARQRFVDVFEPLRPDLYRYSRYLTHSAWEAEELVQDTLARAFVTLGSTFRLPANPKAWLFRVASNVWLDRMRRAREVPGDVPEQVVEDEPGGLVRDAAGSLIGRLAPQERAAVVLKDVFDFTLAEIAESLSTGRCGQGGAPPAGASSVRSPISTPGRHAPRRRSSMRSATRSTPAKSIA